MATYYTIGLQTGATKYTSWNVASTSFDKDSVVMEVYIPTMTYLLLVVIRQSKMKLET